MTDITTITVAEAFQAGLPAPAQQVFFWQGKEVMNMLRLAEDRYQLHFRGSSETLLRNGNDLLDMVDAAHNAAGTVYTYAPRNRPAMYGTVPEGFQNERWLADFPYGVIDYTRRLTAEELYRYELWPVSTNAFEFQWGDKVWLHDVDKAMVIGHAMNGHYVLELEQGGDVQVVRSEYVSPRNV